MANEGPDLDRAVAEAIGLVCALQSHDIPLRSSDGKQFFSDPRDPLPGLRAFQPSTDLNDAFHAAEETGLFEGRWLGRLVTGWAIMDLETMNVVGQDRGCSTPALAICAAILKVLGK